MAALNLPPDPYIALGVSKDAKLAEIRSAHRKLVLKCHPDKVQDEALKAVKQDEFQKVQQAYELLSDDAKRLQYDEQAKLMELRKEMGRGSSSSKPNVFEFEVRTAEPRSTSSYATRSRGPPPPKIYTTHSPPKSYDMPRMYEDIYEKPPRSAKKSSSYESSERKREEERAQREMRRHEEEEKERQKREKERKRTAHGDKKKTQDKEKRRATEEKRTRVNRTFDIESDDEPILRDRPNSWDKARMEEEARLRKDSPRAAPSPRFGTVPLTPKWDGINASAQDYIQAARGKVPGLRRGETFNGPTATYDVRYATVPKPTVSLSDDDTPHRSSYRRRASETPPTTRSRDSKKEKEPSKRSSSRKIFGEIVDSSSSPKTPKSSSRRTFGEKMFGESVDSPSPKTPKTPTLKSATSAPPLAGDFLKPVRSRTEYPRPSKDTMPSPPSRSQTFQSGDRGDRDRDRDRGREREASKLRTYVKYDSTDSEGEPKIFSSPRGSRSPPRPARGSRSPPRPQRSSSDRRREAPETRYSVSKGNVVPKPPLTRHRAEMRNIDDEDYSPRDRSESPGGGRRSERTPVSGGGSRSSQQRSHSQAYYAEPASIPVRTKISREHPSTSSRGSPLFAEVMEPKFANAYRTEDVRYSPQADPYRRGSEPGPRDSYSSPRSGRGEVYVNS